MILYDTPNRDVFNVMKNELDKVSYFIRKNGKKISQYFQDLPYKGGSNIFILRYTVPSSMNTYTIASKRDVTDAINTFTYIKVDGNSGMRKVFFLRKNSSGKNDIFPSPNWVLDIYTGHFLSRYKERMMLPGINGDNLIVQYLEQNKRQGMAIPTEMINPAVRGDNQVTVILNEGLSFVECDEFNLNGTTVNINENKTFVAKDNLFYKQAVSVMSTDFFVKYQKLKNAMKNNASTREIMEIMDSGVFNPPMPM